MAKFFRKTLLVAGIAAAAAGVYCYVKKKNAAADEKADDVEEFDEFDSDVEDDEEDKEKESFKDKERKYVNLAFDKAQAALDKAKGAISRTEEYFNDEIMGDKKAEEVVAEAEGTIVETVEEAAEEAAEAVSEKAEEITDETVNE